MRILLIIFISIIGIGFYTELNAARFDWSVGEPTITDDSANTTYYCWSLGQPTVCYQYQEEQPPTPAGNPTTYNLEIKSGTLQLKAGVIQIK